MASIGKQFKLLLWKNYVLQKRKVLVTVFEVGMPIFFAVLFVLIRLLVKSENIEKPTTWKPFPVNNFETLPPMTNNENISMNNLFYSPNATVVTDLMTKVRAHIIGNVSLQGFKTEEDLLREYRLNSAVVWAAIVFDEEKDYTSGLPDDVKYALRCQPSDPENGGRWDTASTFPFFRVPGFRNDDRFGGKPDYYKTGFLALQWAVDRSVIEVVNSSAESEMDDLDIDLHKMAYPPFFKDFLITVLQQQFPSLIMLSFILNALQTTKNIVYEKEKKLKETMKMMGLSSFVYWMSWLIRELIYFMFCLAVYVALISIKFSEKGSVLANCDPSVIFVFLLCFCISIVCFCFLISTFFQKANNGAYAGGIIYFVTFIPYFFLQARYETMSRGEKLAVSILPNMAMAFGMNTIGIYEGTGSGAQWSNFYKPATVDDNFSLLDAMIMLVADSAICLLLTWYIDAVHPGEFGVPQPFYFPFTKAYWCPSRQDPHTSREHDDARKVLLKSERMEAEPVGLKPGISIRSLRKDFTSNGKKKVAVKDMSLNMYEGQISVLLGHNGAGKSTTMMMLTGFLPPTSGTAVVNGYDIRTNIAEVRQSLGLCPQHNVLFDVMTVEEHLYFFGQLKGCPKERLSAEIDEMIRLVGLEEKRHAKSDVLSGGQKRKLCVGIAFMADSKVVILDEPTSGMDPGARRQTWDILRRCREGRNIILTTHFMDEADILGDRIAIMAEGVVKCCGTSLFLKKLYGAGYHMVMVKGGTCDVAKVTRVVQQHVPNARFDSEIGAEVSYLLPFDQSSQFEKLFLEIESRREELGIQSFGTTATTMEEVFLKVGESAKDEDDVDEEDSLGSDSSTVTGTPTTPIAGFENPGYGSMKNTSPIEEVANGSIRSHNSLPLNRMDSKYIAFNKRLTKNKGIYYSMQQFYAMFVKKMINTWRNRLVTAIQLAFPVIFTIFGLVTEKTIPKFGDEPSLTLDLSPFENFRVAYSAGINATEQTINMAAKYSLQFVGKSIEINRSKFPTFDEYFVHTAADIGTDTYTKNYVIAGDFQPANVSTSSKLTCHFADAPFHSPAISLSYMMNSLFQLYSGDSKSITTVNDPLPQNASESALAIGAAASGTGFVVAFNILFGMAFLASSFILFLINERATGSKHLQVVSGVGPFAYWMSTFLWDLINFLLPSLALLVVFGAFATPAYAFEGRLGVVFLLLFMYGWAIMPFMYIWHYLFKVPSTGMVVMTILNIITGLATTMAVFILKFPSLGAVDVGNALDWVFLILLPNFCLGQGFMNMYTNNEYRDVCNDPKVFPDPIICKFIEHPCCPGRCGDQCFTYYDNFLDWNVPGVGRYVIFMTFQGILYLSIIFLIEFGWLEKFWYFVCQKKRSPNYERITSEVIENGPSNETTMDSNVEEEKRRINVTPLARLMEKDSLILRNLTKTYDNHLAVDGISLGIPKQECFGLLGQNGAGKTTTFKMLTGDVMVTKGDAYLAGFDIKQQIKDVHKNLGYCPQFDALIDQLTGRETLTMFARLRGIVENQIEQVVEDLIDIMLLRKHANKLTMQYSGGNKRKLSTAIALIGDPPFIFLDEPTTGMDPAARRQLWNVLSQVRASGRTLILTSHSMEECDALCTRLVIMVNGQLMCLGSPQHLKNKFGEGYTLEVRVGMTDDGRPQDTISLVQFVMSAFPLGHVFDDQHGYVYFQIPDAGVPLARVFGVMEEAKHNYDIEDYAVHQTTLEQIFLTFTRKQIPPREEKSKSVCKKLCSCC